MRAYFDAGTAQSAVTLWRRTVVEAGGGGAGVSSACPSLSAISAALPTIHGRAGSADAHDDNVEFECDGYESPPDLTSNMLARQVMQTESDFKGAMAAVLDDLKPPDTVMLARDVVTADLSPDIVALFREVIAAAGSLSDGQVREIYRIIGANRNESAGGDDSRGRPSLPDNAGGSLPQPTLHRVRRRRRRRRAASGRTDSSSYSAGVRRGLERTGLRLEATMPRRRLPSSPQQKGGSVTGRRMRERRKRGSGNKRAADPTRRRTKRR